MVQFPPPYLPGPVRRGPRGAYRNALIGAGVVGALLLPMLLCTAAFDVRDLPGCLATLIVLGLPVAGIIWWLRWRQQQQELAYAHAAWIAQQEQQRRLAYEAWVAEQQRQRRIMHLKTLGDLLVKTPTEFELAIVDLLPSLGFIDVQHTGKTGDLGADVLCLTQAGEKVIVQCKQYGTGKKVSRPEIQAFMGACMHFNATRGLFITTSNFTQDARELAQEHDLEAIDGETLTGLIHTAQQRLGSQAG